MDDGKVSILAHCTCGLNHAVSSVTLVFVQAREAVREDN